LKNGCCVVRSSELIQDNKTYVWIFPETHTYTDMQFCYRISSPLLVVGQIIQDFHPVHQIPLLPERGKTVICCGGMAGSLQEYLPSAWKVHPAPVRSGCFSRKNQGQMEC